MLKGINGKKGRQQGLSKERRGRYLIMMLSNSISPTLEYMSAQFCTKSKSFGNIMLIELQTLSFVIYFR